MKAEHAELTLKLCLKHGWPWLFWDFPKWYKQDVVNSYMVMYSTTNKTYMQCILQTQHEHVGMLNTVNYMNNSPQH